MRVSPLGAATLGATGVFVVRRAIGHEIDTAGMLVLISFLLTAVFLVNIVWTHLVYTRTEPAGIKQILADQQAMPLQRASRIFGFRSSVARAVTASVVAFIGSLAASVYGLAGGIVGVTVAALGMAATAWVMVAYAYALAYLRLHVAGESFAFEHDDEPAFRDFAGLALMVSSAGSHIPAVPTTRAGTRAMRGHTVIAFVFNALVIAMTVSLITNLVAAYAA